MPFWLCHSRTLLCAVIALERVLDRLSNQNGAIHRRESTRLSEGRLVNAGHTPFRVNLGRANIECGLREEHIHLHCSSYRGRQFRAHINTAAAYVAARTLAALHNPLGVAPRKYDRETQTKTFGASSLTDAFTLFHALRCAPHPLVQHNRADSSNSTPARKCVKMTIVECDEGPRPARSANPPRDRTLYSALEVDKSLSSNASSRVLRAPLRDCSRRIRVEQNWGTEVRKFTLPDS